MGTEVAIAKAALSNPVTAGAAAALVGVALGAFIVIAAFEALAESESGPSAAYS